MVEVDVSSQGCTSATEKWHNGKSDENLRGLQTSPPPNKWFKRKAAALITTSPVCLVDSGIWWILIVAIQCWFTCHVITQVPSPELPQEESAPRALHAKYLNCLTVRKKRGVVKRGLWIWARSVQCFCHYVGCIKLKKNESQIKRIKRLLLTISAEIYLVYSGSATA